MLTLENEHHATKLATFQKTPSIEVRLNLSHEDYEIIEAISYSGRFPYKYPADFLREAIRVLIDKLSSEEHLGRLVAEYNDLQAERYRAMFDALARKIQKAVAQGRFRNAHLLLRSYDEQVRNEPRSNWRDWFLEKVHKELFPAVNDPYDCLIGVSLGRAQKCAAGRTAYD